MDKCDKHNAYNVKIDIPTCGRAYLPKVNFRRPGNMILGLFLVFLILLFAGLAMSQATHNYGNVDMVVNVEKISANELMNLRSNQMAFRANEGHRPSYRVLVHAPITDDEDTGKINDLSSLESGISTVRPHHANAIQQRHEKTRRVQLEYRRSPMPLIEARALLNSIPTNWPVNDTVSRILNDWKDKFEIMSNDQNLEMLKFLLNHFSANRTTRAASGFWLVTLERQEELKPLVRERRQLLPPCEVFKKKVLSENENHKRSIVKGWMMLSEKQVCFYASRCESGMYPSLAGCQSSPDSVLVEMNELHMSDESFTGRQELIPDPDLTDICMLGDIVLDKCALTKERTMQLILYKIQGSVGYWLGDSTIQVAPLFTSLSDFNCTGVASPKCNGDDTFKRVFMSAGADNSCYCVAAPTSQIVYLVIAGTRYRVDMASTEIVKVLYRRHAVEELNCINCEISCNQGEVRVDYEKSAEMVELCSGRFCLDLKPAKIFTVPLSLAAIDHVFNYYIRFEDNKEMRGSVTCKIDEMCPLIDCHLCYEKLKNPQCYNFVDKINFIVLVLAWFLTVAIIAKVMKMIGYIYTFIKTVFKVGFRLGFWITKKLCGYMGTQVTRVNEVISKTVEQPDGSIKTTSRTSKRIVFNRNPTYIKSFVIICLFLPLVLGCSETKVLTSKQLNCIMGQNGMKCSTVESVSISVAPIGQSSCFIMKSLDGKIIGSLTAVTNSLDLLCNEEDLYYTFPGKSTFDQKCFCTASSSGLGSEEKCNKYNMGRLCSNPLRCVKGLATSGCKTARGGWEEGCFSYGSKYCYYVAHVINPYKLAYKVSHCSSFYWQANIGLKIQTNNSTETVKSNLNAGSKMNFQGGNIQLISASVPPIPVLDSCFVRTEQGIFLADCQKGGGITKGKIGEIQCPSESSAKFPSDSCSFASELIHIEPRGGYLMETSSMLDFSHMKKKLPIRSGGYVIKLEGGVIKASLNQISMMSIRLTLDQINVLPYSTETKCSVKFSSMKGCVSCLTGSVLMLRAKTTMGETKAILDCPSLKAQIPFIIKGQEEYVKLITHFESGKIDESCKVTCPGNVVDVSISGNLVSDIAVVRTVDDHLSDYTEVMTSWFKDIFGQFDYLLLIPLIVIIVVGSLFIIKIVLWQGSRDYHRKRY